MQGSCGTGKSKVPVIITYSWGGKKKKKKMWLFTGEWRDGDGRIREAEDVLSIRITPVREAFGQRFGHSGIAAGPLSRAVPLPRASPSLPMLGAGAPFPHHLDLPWRRAMCGPCLIA